MIRKTISMPDKMGSWITTRIDSGQYNNESEYFRDLVRRDQQEEDRAAYLLARLETGERQITEGTYVRLNNDRDIDVLFDGLESNTE